ncbi:hypothetical protein ACJZ2D_005225 [Fusarium nematophilum]
MADDSPLSVTASVVGILTFVIALIAGVYARAIWLMSKIKSDLDIAETCSSLVERLRQTTRLEKSVFDANPSEQDGEVIALYLQEIELAAVLIRVARQSPVRRMREWNKEQQNMIQGLRYIDNSHNNIRWLQLQAHLYRVSAKVDTILEQIHRQPCDTPHPRGTPNPGGIHGRNISDELFLRAQGEARRNWDAVERQEDAAERRELGEVFNNGSPQDLVHLLQALGDHVFRRGTRLGRFSL